VRAWRWSIGPFPLGGRELVIVGALLGALAAALYYPHVLHGGFYSDDWLLSSTYRLPTPDLSRIADTDSSGRIVLPWLKTITHALFGLHFRGHLAAAAALGAATSLFFYAFLRAVGWERLHAGLVAALVLTFPWSDSARLWTTGAANQFAICFALLGVIVALRGVGSARRGWAWHLLAVGLYAVAALTYESVGVLTLLAGLVYRLRAPWRRVLTRWVTDVAVVAPILIWSHERTARFRALPNLDQAGRDVPEFARQVWSLLGLAVRPFSIPVAIPVAGVAALLILLALRFPRDAAARTQLRRWATTAVAGLVATIAAWVAFPGTGLYPTSGGLDNRVNLAAAPALLVVLYALAVVGGVLAFQGRWRPWAPAVPIAVAAFLGLGYCYGVRGDIILWDRAAAAQNVVLDSVARALPPRPHPGTTIYTAGEAATVAPGISIFSVPWDLNYALKLRWHDVTLRGFPLVGTAGIECGQAGVRAVAPPNPVGVIPGGYDASTSSGYGHAVVVSVPTARALPINDRSTCERIRASVVAGPIIDPHP
jgi:hypothetical protein